MKSPIKNKPHNQEPAVIHKYRIFLLFLLTIIIAALIGYCIYVSGQTLPPTDGVLV